jgi:hypothetical protein
MLQIQFYFVYIQNSWRNKMILEIEQNIKEHSVYDILKDKVSKSEPN